MPIVSTATSTMPAARMPVTVTRWCGLASLHSIAHFVNSYSDLPHLVSNVLDSFAVFLETVYLRHSSS